MKLFISWLTLVFLLGLSAERAQATNVCGDVSGVWNLAGSPYQVTCDVTVPNGQTLTIAPGVQVLFTGHYKFNVLGNLQAIGTAQGSIVFTRSFPTEESKWQGIRFADQADDASRLAYCTIEYGLANGTAPYNSGGGLFIDRCNVTVEHSVIRQNSASDGGGVAVFGDCTPLFSHCELAYNHADDTVGGGGAILHQPSPTNGGTITLDHCVLHHNSAGYGGAIWQGRGNFQLVNCTLSENVAFDQGGAINLWHSTVYTVTLENCISWGNTAPSGSKFYFGESAGSAVATYSDIQGGYPGTGNIDADPMFVDATNGDFHLLSGSPCIDTGNPASPLDPDGSRSDMGAFPYCHPTLLPFVDDFDSPAMDPCWTWVREDAGLWSLSERPGWLRLRTNGNFHQPQSNTTRSIPLRSFADGNFFIETKLDFAINNCAGAGLIFYKDDDNFVDVMVIEVAEPDLQGIKSHNQINNAYQGASEYILDWHPVYLRILKSGNFYTTFASPDSANWVVIGAFMNDLAVDGLIRCGLYAMDCDRNLYFPADFDYFRADVEGNLPVDMISFEAVPGDQEIVISWVTGSESAVSHFELARDGELITNVDATNVPTGHHYVWRDTGLENGRAYAYSLTTVDLDGTRTRHGTVTATPRAEPLPTEFVLHQNFPNPFNPETAIRFDLPEASDVQLVVFNTMGRQVAQLVNGNLPTGSHTVNFDASRLPSGVYLYRLTVGSLSMQKKMVLLK